VKPSPIRPVPQIGQGDSLKRVLLLIDYSNILYRSYFSSIKGWEERPWLPILRFIDSLRLCVQRSKIEGIPTQVIFAGESRKKLERSKLDSSYKSQRVPVQHVIFRNFRKIMALILADMGTQILSRDGAEADDIIASVVKCVCRDSQEPLNKEYTTDVVIFTNDKDLYQLLRFDRCYIYQNPGQFYTRELFIDEYKFYPSEFDVYKAMVGDKTDNIPGVNGIGPVKARTNILDNTVPIYDSKFINALNLVSLDYDLDVPDMGEILYFDDTLFQSRDHIYEAYGRDGRAFEEIQLAFRMLEEVYKTKK